MWLWLMKITTQYKLTMSIYRTIQGNVASQVTQPGGQFCKQGKSPDGQILNQSKLCHSFIHNLSSCVHLFHSGLIFHDISPTLKLHWVVWRCVRWIGDQRCGYLFQNKWCIGFSTIRHHNILQDSKKKYKFCRWIGWFIKKVHKWKKQAFFPFWKYWSFSFLSSV